MLQADAVKPAPPAEEREHIRTYEVVSSPHYPPRFRVFGCVLMPARRLLPLSFPRLDAGLSKIASTFVAQCKADLPELL